MKLIKILFFILILPALTFSQDTIRVMTYNVLNYDGGPSSKNENLKAIIDLIDPDILVIEEIETTSAVSSLLNNVLSSEYSAGDFVFDPLTSNAVYYKNHLFEFLSNRPIETTVRDISEFSFIYKQSKDTLIVYGVHLKASSGNDNELQRLSEVTELRKVTDKLPRDKNFLIVGDFNIYSSNEPAYQKLLDRSGPGYFVDPINISGVWNNSGYSEYHTQSTRTSNMADGGSTGGLDDRFDFILYSQAVADAGVIEFVEGSYTNFGNDGNHYNQAINQIPNGAVSQEIANALFYASDHLPVYADFTIVVDTTIDYYPEIANMKRDILVPLDNQTFSVSANVSDDRIVSEVKLHYAIDGDSTGFLLMDSENEYTYSAAVPINLLDDGNLFEYWITAADNRGQMTSNKENIDGFFAGITDIVQLKPVDLNGNLLYKNYYARIKGALTVPDSTFSNYYLDVYVQDSTAGINIFKNAAAGKVDLEKNNVYEVTGMLDEFYGKTEFVPDDPLLDIIEAGKVKFFVPEDISIDELLITPELYEGNLVRLSNVNKISGEWASTGSNANLIVNDGSSENIILRIDKETDIDGSDEPGYPIFITGIFAQYDETSPYTDGYQILPRSLDDLKDSVVSVDNNEIAIEEFRLYQNYPNPFNPTTTIKFALPQEQKVKLEIFNLLGQKVTTLIDNKDYQSGVFIKVWNGKDNFGNIVPSGIYIYRIKAGNFVKINKMAMLK